jgi:hypothetical protein
VVGLTTGSRGKVPGKTCEKKIRDNNNSRQNIPMLLFYKIKKIVQSTDVSIPQNNNILHSGYE